MTEAYTEQGAFRWPAEAPVEGVAPTMVADSPAPSPVGDGLAGGEPPTTAAVPAPRRPARSLDALPPDNELWDVHAAARFLKRSVSWVYHRAEDGSLPVKRIGGWGLRFIPAELRAWVAAGGARRRRG